MEQMCLPTKSRLGAYSQDCTRFQRRHKDRENILDRSGHRPALLVFSKQIRSPIFMFSELLSVAIEFRNLWFRVGLYQIIFQCFTLISAWYNTKDLNNNIWGTLIKSQNNITKGLWCAPSFQPEDLWSLNICQPHDSFSPSRWFIFLSHVIHVLQQEDSFNFIRNQELTRSVLERKNAQGGLSEQIKSTRGFLVLSKQNEVPTVTIMSGNVQ